MNRTHSRAGFIPAGFADATCKRLYGFMRERLPAMNNTLTSLVLYVVLTIQVLTWAGVLEPPSARESRDNHAASLVSTRVEDHTNLINAIRMDMAVSHADRLAIHKAVDQLNDKFDAITRVLISLERSARNGG